MKCPQEYFLQEIPKRGDLVELDVMSLRGNHLGEGYVVIHEVSKVTRIIKNNNGEVRIICLNGFVVKRVKISKNLKSYVTLNRRILNAELSIING